LYLALKCLKDIEHHSHLQAADLGLDRQTDLVTGPHNVLGIELNEYAAELAGVTVWIGELQWRIDHGYEFKTNPVREPLDHIECRDALLTGSGDTANEADWPAADVLVGNPPFLGGSKKRGELGAAYANALDATFAPAVPGSADLVCYWFHKALRQMEAGNLGMVFKTPVKPEWRE
jgi:type II restriction/modification system DNA methylase subunit YeeA